MNPKLVESLAEAINALAPDDYALFQSTLIAKTIQKTEGICGGHARIRNTRIAVWTLISLTQQRMDEDTLLHNFPGLTPFDLLAARTYYKANTPEIDALIVSHHSRETSRQNPSHKTGNDAGTINGENAVN
ncbi:MAG: DUF433 domain-containing protein [Arthrospira sp. SH-MAG29]|nr:DUF433 domain-containing protein [Arthrospira sp. SH-MAG29]MBS0016858.1 DUF433 domain-containing protein [Arthrospira sp. SH-MAG29]